MKIIIIKQIDVDDWDDFVVEHYGKPYSFQQQDGCKPRGIETISLDWMGDFDNTEIPFKVNGDEMGVSFETWLNADPEDTKKHFNHEWENNMFWDRNFYPDASMILKDLYDKGLVTDTEYQINIDW